MRPSRFELLVIGLIGLVQAPGLVRLGRVYAEVDYASHGFLVPLVALWAATAHRAELAALPRRREAGGLAMLALLSLASLGAQLQGNATAVGVTFVASVAATVFALRGRRWVRLLAFPLGFLVFMIPLPPSWITPVIVQLQLVVSTVGVAVLRGLGVAIHREGNVLELPGDVTLFVAEACSGITSLVTLLPIGVFVAYFTESRLGRRVALVLAVIPVALAGNLLRVLLTVALAIRVDVEFATSGPLHEWAGVTTYVVGCLCLLAIGRILHRLWPEPGEVRGA